MVFVVRDGVLVGHKGNTVRSPVALNHQFSTGIETHTMHGGVQLRGQDSYISGLYEIHVQTIQKDIWSGVGGHGDRQLFSIGIHQFHAKADIGVSIHIAVQDHSTRAFRVV